MSIKTQDPDTIRRYLLGQLTEDEETATQQRLLTDDDFFDELELTKDELIEAYLEDELLQPEREWLEQNFLASPEGKQRKGLAKNLDRYVLSQPPAAKKNLSWAEKMAGFWNAQPIMLRAAAGLAVVAVVAVIFWPSRAPSPQSFATLTLTNSPSTRSSGNESPKVKLKEAGLRITLLLPDPAKATPALRYRAELLNEKSETKTFEGVSQDAQSVMVEIPAGELIPGQHALTLSTIDANGTPQRIPGSYHFTVE